MTLTAKTGTWLRTYHASPQAAVRLICFPFAGGSASYYFPFSQLLAPGIEVLAVQYPGRQDRLHEPCLDTVPELAGGAYTGIRDEALATGDDRPLAFFGHSLGAIVAFEVALRLQRATGRPPARLFLSGGRVQPYRTAGFEDDAGLLDELRRMGGSDERLFSSTELQDMVLPAVRADYRAIGRYVHPGSARVDSPITALIGDADPRTTPREAEAWGDCTTAGFDLRVFPGGHFYLDDHRDQVLEVITSTLRGLPAAPEEVRHAL
jgi:pyochelin biosynthesis protein PchC